MLYCSCSRTLLDLHKMCWLFLVLIISSASSVGAVSPRAVLLADNLNNRATQLRAEQRYDEAAAILERVVEILTEQLGVEHTWTLLARNELAVTYRDVGAYTEAIGLAKKTLEIQEKYQGLYHQHTLASYHNIADFHTDINDPYGALPFIAVAVERKTLAFGVDKSTARSINTYGQILRQLGDFEEAERQLTKAYDMFVETVGEEHMSTIIAMGNRGGALRQLGRLHEAEQLQRATLRAMERKRGVDDPLTLSAMNNLGLTLRDLGRHREALNLTLTNIERSRRILGDAHPNTATAFSNAGTILTVKGLHGEAVKMYETAIAVLDRVQMPESPSLKLLFYSNLSTAYYVNGDIEKASELDQALYNARKKLHGDDHPETLRSLNNLVLTETVSGRVDGAYEKSLFLVEKMRAVLTEEHPRTIETMANHALVAYAAGAYDVSLSAARAALDGERAAYMAASKAPRETRTRRASNAAYVGGLVSVAAWEMAALKPDLAAALRAEAFEAAQSVSGGAAAAAMARSAARVAAKNEGLSALVEAFESSLAGLAVIDDAYARVAFNETGLNPDSEAALRVKIAERRALLIAQRDSAASELQERFPDFWALVSPEAVSVAELQGKTSRSPLLGEQEALVLFQPPTALLPGYIWAVTREQSAWAKIEMNREELVSRVARLHQMLDLEGSRAGPGSGDVIFDRSFAHEFFEDLFGDPEISAILQAKPDWIIMPQGAFLSLPFAALVTDTPEGDDASPAALRATSWLGLGKALSITPSAAALRRRGPESHGEAERPGADIPYLGVADPAFDSSETLECGDVVRGLDMAISEQLADGAYITEIMAGLPPLPCTRLEAETVAEAFGAGADRLFLGDRATEDNLAKAESEGLLPRAGVIHFATHGVLGGQYETEPGLALTPPTDGPKVIAGLLDPTDLSGGEHAGEALIAEAVLKGAWIDDGLFTLSEIARLDLNADWVILSACDTADGRDQSPGSEGLSGIAQAFLYAGARALMVSHWRVNDVLAARLTILTVQNQRRFPHHSRAASLRAAMREIVGDESWDDRTVSLAHPSAWAPFQIVDANLAQYQ
jgi:CHAT domain-containing protein/tetratricopeptide (TPR) repeat protein